MSNRRVHLSFVLLYFLGSSSACVVPPKPPKDSLTLAIEERARNPGPRPPAPTTSPKLDEGPEGRKSKPVEPPSAARSPETDAIATVGTTSISRDDFLALLIRSRGVPVLEQFVGLAAAEDHARKRGVTITKADLEFEYELTLRRLSDPLAFPTSESFDQADAERLLESILASRQMSRQEFLLTVRRNAYLRKVLAGDLKISDDQLASEFELAYGERLQVRHIQLGNLGDATRIKERLSAGEDFADLAARYSTNVSTARRGGLLDPFSVRDDSVALAMRETAARLTTGEVSDVVRIGEWYHILKLDKLVPPSQRSLDSVREPLRQRIVVRLTDPRMRELHERLFTQAAVQIHDPTLRESYQAIHGRK